jgi:hypothetical protein
MKNLSLVSLIVLGAICTTKAQKFSADKLPVAVKTAFEKAYPNAKQTKWDKEKNDFED